MPRQTRHRCISSAFSPGKRPGTHARANSRRLRFETLEERQLLTITVNTLVDENNGTGVGGISLREAINAAAVGETINFSVTGTMNLASIGSRHLPINKSLTIEGPGAGLLTIKALDPDANGANDSDGWRVFLIDDGDDGGDPGSLIDVTISGLTLINGDPQGDTADTTTGGSIFNFENLTLNGCVITGNHAANGGAIYSRFGTVTINDSTISGNDSDDGGGLLLEGSSATINRSTFHDNYAGNEGGAIFNRDGNLTIVDSTISGNGADLLGGGISNYYGNLSVTNSTISGNFANLEGGAIHSKDAQTVLAHSTITGNSVTNESGIGGGIRSDGNSTHLDHTIVAGNLRAGARNDVSGTFTAEFSLVGDRGGTTVTNQGGSLIGTSASPINAMLGPLANNGGPTLTHALLIDSPAIDAGDAAAMAGINDVPEFDQRGSGFPRILDGDNVGGARIDIGALEAPVPGPALPGDYNLNGVVDTADFTVWRDNLGASVPAFSSADGDGNGVVEQSDYDLWKANFGNALPMPASGSAGSVGASLVAVNAVPMVAVQSRADDGEPSTQPMLINWLPTRFSGNARDQDHLPQKPAALSANASAARVRALELLYSPATEERESDGVDGMPQIAFADASSPPEEFLASVVDESRKAAWRSVS